MAAILIHFARGLVLRAAALPAAALPAVRHEVFVFIISIISSPSARPGNDFIWTGSMIWMPAKSLNVPGMGRGYFRGLLPMAYIFDSFQMFARPGVGVR